MKKILLDAFFKPDSVAVIGASEKAGRIGSTLVQNLIRGGFAGSIFPINRNYPEIHGLTAYDAVTSLPDPVDLAIIAIPIKDVPEVIRECGQAGIKAAIIISAGGREVGPGGKEIEAAIKAEAAAAGVRYLGPNTMGLICARHPSQRQPVGLCPAGGEPGLHLPERRPVQLHPGLVRPEKPRLQPLRQRRFHDRSGLRRPHRLPGQ